MKFKDTKYGDLTGRTHKGSISVSNSLTSLEGSPKFVSGNFSCSSTNIIDLKGAPKSVNGDFSCSNVDITSLDGAPKIVLGSYYCHDTNITSLEGAPKTIYKNFNCSNNQKLVSIEGTPITVRGDFDCTNNPKLTQEEIYKLLDSDIKGKIAVPKGLKAPTKEDYIVYNKLNKNMKKFIKLKTLKDKLK